MATQMQSLRNKAKLLGIDTAAIRKAKTVSELQDLILNGDAPAPTPAKRKPGRPAKATTTRKATPAKRGRPAKATPKPVAKKTAIRTPASTNGDAGRIELGDVDFSVTDGWNARPGSAPDRIIGALRRFKGNRAKVFDFLSGDVWEFVGRKLRDGSRRSQASADDMLRYRISRTAWDFAIKTGQHEKSTNRAEYGTGTRKPTKAKPTRKATRTPARSQKPAQRPTKAGTRRVVKRTATRTTKATRPVKKTARR